MTADARRVVVIGGGFAGGHVAQGLEKDSDLKVTLVDAKEFNEVRVRVNWMPQAFVVTSLFA